MATAAQIEANRLNAQKSTGPRTAEGKTESRHNALKHGVDAASILIPGEDPDLYDQLAADYARDIRPNGALERFQVDTLVRADWQRRRLQLIEARLYRELIKEGASEELDPAILRDSPTGKLLLRLWSQIASLERAHLRALSEIRRFRRERVQIELAALEAELDDPELPAMMAAARERYRARNEPNSGPKPAPDPVRDNPALRL